MIVKIYHTSKDVDNRLIGYLKVSESDFHRIPIQGRSNKFKILPNQFLYKKVKNELKKEWSDNFGWKILSPVEITELIDSYHRKARYHLASANRLETLNNL